MKKKKTVKKAAKKKVAKKKVAKKKTARKEVETPLKALGEIDHRETLTRLKVTPTPEFTDYSTMPDHRAKAGLYQKIHKVSALIPVIECTRKEQDGEGAEAEIYYYTEAAVVFELYSHAFRVVGLTFTPVGIKTYMDGGFYRADMKYRVTDIETGYSIDVVGSGLGGNGGWSLNTAQTVARKQMLLNTFGAAYKQPESMKDVVKRLSKGFNVDSCIQIATAGEASEEIKEFFGQQLEAKENK